MRFNTFQIVLLLSFWGFPLLGAEVWVSILPQKYFVERIGGDSVKVEVLVRAGQSPETYAPGAAQLARLARADVFFGIGMPMEAQILPRVAASMPNLRVVPWISEASEGPGHPAHGHGDAHIHCAHDGVDPHVWMNPVAMIEFVTRVQNILTELEPASAAAFASNAAVLKADLKEVDAVLKKRFLPHAGRAFYINHPALGHFSARYGLQQKSIEMGGSAPSAGGLARLIGEARSDRVGAVFSQPEFGRSSAETLARSLRVPVVEVNPLSENYLVNLEAIADKLLASF